LTGYKSMIYLV